jgi:hypothetical protein
MKRSEERAMILYTLLCTFILYLNPFMSYRDTKFQTNSDVF